MRSVKAMFLALLWPAAPSKHIRWTRKALPAETYVFKVAAIYPNLDIIQILSPDQTKVYATVMSIPAYRKEPTDNPVIEFEERPAHSPEAIQAWFYPQTLYGHRFVYPKTRPWKALLAADERR